MKKKKEYVVMNDKGEVAAFVNGVSDSESYRVSVAGNVDVYGENIIVRCGENVLAAVNGHIGLIGDCEELPELDVEFPKEDVELSEEGVELSGDDRKLIEELVENKLDIINKIKGALGLDDDFNE
jgi:hypothetical protein